MNVVRDYPPNIDEIVRAFGVQHHPGVIYAWGDTVFVPGLHIDDMIPLDIMVHEATHARQQEAVGGPRAWWRRYIDDVAFRFEQEVEAYRAQLASFPNRQQRRAAVKRLARDLAGPIYGHMVTFDEARAILITPP